MAVNANVSFGVSGSQSSALDLGTVTFPFAASFGAAYSTGTGAGQVDRVYTKIRTLSASGTEDLDLAGSLTDALGATITFARIKALFVKAAVGNTNLVQVTRSGSNGVPWLMAAGDGIALRPGEFQAFGCDATDATGYVVTGGTGDLITFTNSAGTTGVTYTIVVLGCSA